MSYPSLSIFSPQTPPLPPDSFLAGVQSTPSDLLAIIDPILANRPRNSLQLTPDGSAADPASLGVAVLLANATTAGNNASYYGEAAQKQLQALLTATPRTPDGAISHRVSQVQLWSDFMYMVSSSSTLPASRDLTSTLPRPRRSSRTTELSPLMRHSSRPPTTNVGSTANTSKTLQPSSGGM